MSTRSIQSLFAVSALYDGVLGIARRIVVLLSFAGEVVFLDARQLPHIDVIEEELNVFIVEKEVRHENLQSNSNS